MNQKFPSVRSRDWRIPDPSCPLQNLIRKSSSPQINPGSVTPPTGNIPARLKDVAKPTSFGKFLVILTMHICRKFLYFNLKYRLIIYLFSTAVISLITDHFPPPGSFLSDPTNVLNTYFVAYSWTITCGILAGFIYLTSNVFCCGQLWGIHRNMSRLIALAAWCYFCSLAFDFIEYRYSFCMKGGNVSKELCSGRWISFAISNRTFLLTQSIIAISEEIKALAVWEKLGETFNKKETEGAPLGSSEGHLRNARKYYESGSTYVKCMVIVLTVLIILLDVANLGTIVYFNNMPQKVLANIFAIIGWMITYKSWFNQKSFLAKIWCPGIPGQNMLIPN